MPEPPSRVWVGGLPSDIAELELYQEFSRHGSVASVAIRSSIRDTFAFVEMDQRGAEAAVRAMNGAPLWGSPHLNVRIANDNQISRPLDSRSGLVDRGPRPLDGDRGRLSPARSEVAGGQCLSIDDDGDWDPLDIWRDCLGQKGSRRSSPRGDACPRYELVPRPGYRGDIEELQGRERSPRRGSGPSSPGRRSRQGSPRPRGGASPRRGPLSLLPPPPAGSVEHARFDEGAVEWRARHLTITVENIPWDLGWMELKNLGRTYGFVAHARTYAEGGTNVGVLEFSRREVADRAKEGLDGHVIAGAKRPLAVRVGAPPELLKTGGKR